MSWIELQIVNVKPTYGIRVCSVNGVQNKVADNLFVQEEIGRYKSPCVGIWWISCPHRYRINTMADCLKPIKV